MILPIFPQVARYIEIIYRDPNTNIRFVFKPTF